MVVFHIGYHKTASTWLRRSVFPAMPGIAFQPRSRGILAEWVRHLLAAPESEFLAAGMRETLRESEQQAGGQAVVVSNEDLSGELFGGGDAGLRSAERLHRVAPEARILAVIRRQDDIARSIHSQYVNLGGYRALGPFLAGRAEGCAFDPADLAYDRLLARYVDLFGAARVTVVPYELLRADPGAFLERVAGACGARGAGVTAAGAGDNVSLSRYPTLALRAWNRALRRSPYNASPLVALPGASRLRHALQRGVEPRLPPSLRRRRATAAERALLADFARQFAASNARTAQLAGWDLAAFGYALPARGP